MKKNMEGITLVSLVITIIVMLILAGVSINMATGDNGVLTRASGASLKTKLSKIYEDFTLAVSDVEMQYKDAATEDSGIGAYKGVFHTVEKLNKTLKETNILCYNSSDVKADEKGTAKSDIITSNFKNTQQDYLSGYASAMNNSPKLKKQVYTTEHPIVQILCSNKTTAISTLKNPGKEKYFSLYLSDGKNSAQLGSNTYVAVCNIEDGVPIIVDLGLVQNGVDTNLKNELISTYTAKTDTFSVPTKANTYQLSGLMDVSWYNNAKGLTNYVAGKAQE